MKKEYAKLHDRYTELFKTHMDYMERTKILMGTDRLENFGVPSSNRKLNNLMTRSAGPMSYGFESMANNSSMMKSLTSPDGTTSILNAGGNLRHSNIQEEMSMDDISETPDGEIPNGADDDFDGNQIWPMSRCITLYHFIKNADLCVANVGMFQNFRKEVHSKFSLGKAKQKSN
jgi:hypothetical protein